MTFHLIFDQDNPDLIRKLVEEIEGRGHAVQIHLIKTAADDKIIDATKVSSRLAKEKTFDKHYTSIENFLERNFWI